MSGKDILTSGLNPIQSEGITLKYKDLQIIKHSLQHYINRNNATQKEIEEEKRLLSKITNQVNDMKRCFNIQPKEKHPPDQTGI